MTVPLVYKNIYLPVKSFLNAYRALSDGRTGVRLLEEHLETRKVLVSEWKVIWIGACTLLRSSIDLFKVDARSCIDQQICEEIKNEWRSIEQNKGEHPIFWEFLRKERNNVIHEYNWTAYEAWMKEDGEIVTGRMSLLTFGPEDAKSVLMMRNGYYAGSNSLELLKESAVWAENRIFNAIRRAGFDPEEERNISTFKSRDEGGGQFGIR